MEEEKEFDKKMQMFSDDIKDIMNSKTVQIVSKIIEIDDKTKK